MTSLTEAIRGQVVNWPQRQRLVLKVLGAAKCPLSAGDIHNELRAHPGVPWSDTTTRGILSRCKQDGQVSTSGAPVHYSLTERGKAAIK